MRGAAAAAAALLCAASPSAADATCDGIFGLAVRDAPAVNSDFDAARVIPRAVLLNCTHLPAVAGTDGGYWRATFPSGRGGGMNTGGRGWCAQLCFKMRRWSPAVHYLHAVWRPGECACTGSAMPDVLRYTPTGLGRDPAQFGSPAALLIDVPVRCAGLGREECGADPRCAQSLHEDGSGLLRPCCVPRDGGEEQYGGAGSIAGVAHVALGCAFVVCLSVVFALHLLRERTRRVSSLRAAGPRRTCRRVRSRFKRRARFVALLSRRAHSPKCDHGCCCICLDDLVPGQGDVVQLPACRHTLHLACALKFVEYEVLVKGQLHPTCPACRQRLVAARRKKGRRRSHERMRRDQRSSTDRVAPQEGSDDDELQMVDSGSADQVRALAELETES